MPITHFCLMHADLFPIEDNWLITMLDEMDEFKLDVLSAVSPIKDHRGITSTGLDMSSTGALAPHPWPVRRFTMHEVLKILPPTFFGPQACELLKVPGIEPSDATLVVNTGLLLMRLDPTWITNICFTINDVIRRNDEGHYHAFCEPEDWNFSRQLRKLGIRYAATTKVKLKHDGPFEYQSYFPWGIHEQDPQFCESKNENENVPAEESGELEGVIA